MIYFLYTGELHTSIARASLDDLVSLFYLSTRFLIDSFRDRISLELLKHLNVDNALQVLMLAREHGATPLTEHAVNYIAKNPDCFLAAQMDQDQRRFCLSFVQATNAQLPSNSFHELIRYAADVFTNQT
jgi:hypothetical protein